MHERRQHPGGLREGADRRPRRAARRASAAGDVLGGHQVLLDAYNTDVRPLVRERARARSAPRRTRSRALRASGRVERMPRARDGGGDAMSADHRADRVRRRPLAGATAPRRTTRSTQLVRASNLLGADRAVSNFGGGNTSAKGTAIDHIGRERRGRCGSRAPAATSRRWAAATSPRCGCEEVLPLIERDEMSDEEMVAHLVRCQLDPAMPRPSIETLLHAFVPAAHVHHTHPDGINILAGSAARRAAACASASATRPPGSPTSGPGFTLSKQVGEAVRDSPGLRARRARQARPRRLGRHGRGGLPRDDRGDQPRRSRSSTSARRAPQRFGGPAAARSTTRRGTRRCMQLLPAIRGAISSRAREAAVRRRVAEGARVRLVAGRAGARRRSARPAPTTSCTPSACRCGCRSTRRPTTSRRSRSASAPPPRTTAPPTARYVARVRARTTRRWIRTRASCSCSTSASSASARRSPPRASRATSTTARWR